MSTETNKAIARQVLETLDQQDYDALVIYPGPVETLQRRSLIRRAFPDITGHG